MAFAIWRRRLRGGPAARLTARRQGPRAEPAPSGHRHRWGAARTRGGHDAAGSVRGWLCLTPMWSCRGADELDVELARLTLALAGVPPPRLHPHCSGVMGGLPWVPLPPILCSTAPQGQDGGRYAARSCLRLQTPWPPARSPPVPCCRIRPWWEQAGCPGRPSSARPTAPE